MAAFEEGCLPTKGMSIHAVLKADGTATYVSNFLPTDAADTLLHQALEQISWQKLSTTVFGQTHAVPRLSAWFSEVDRSYSYSGCCHKSQPMPRFVRQLQQSIVGYTRCPFNSVLVNLYKDGEHCVGWHADNEPELDSNQPIASLSVGVVRDFRFRHRLNKQRTVTISSEHGSLLMMYPPIQEFWEHTLPRRTKSKLPRVNFSFRTIKT